jgi:hypothetical protein
MEELDRVARKRKIEYVAVPVVTARGEGAEGCLTPRKS